MSSGTERIRKDYGAKPAVVDPNTYLMHAGKAGMPSMIIKSLIPTIAGGGSAGDTRTDSRVIDGPIDYRKHPNGTTVLGGSTTKSEPTKLTDAQIQRLFYRTKGLK
jgi:hypothetical protein